MQRPRAGVSLRRLPEADHGRYGMAAGHRVVSIVVRRNLLSADCADARSNDGPLEHSPGGIARPPLLPVRHVPLGLSSKSLVIFTLLFALAEAASAVQTPIGYAKAISAWFDRRRGLALGIAMSGVGLGGFIMPQLSHMLIYRRACPADYPLPRLFT